MRASGDAGRILLARALRGFADGLVSVLLAGYLTRLGFTSLEIGAIVTGTLLGSAALTIGVGLAGRHLARRRVLLGASALMLATGIGFAGIPGFWPLLVVAGLGTLKPSAGDVGVFLPTEQAALAQTASGPHRTRLSAWYNVASNFTGALGSLASGLPAAIAHAYAVDVAVAERSGFVLYALVALVIGALYLRLGREVETGAERAAGGCLPPAARVALPDGRAGPSGVRDGGRPTRRARGRRQRDECPPQPGGGPAAALRGRHARALDRRVAAGVRGHPQGGL